MSYATKVYGSVYAAGTFLVAAVIVGFFHLWWVAGLLGIGGLVGFVVAVRNARSGSESERRQFVEAGERALGAAGRAEGGGWSPRRRRGE
jgi:hypothetical protein